MKHLVHALIAIVLVIGLLPAATAAEPKDPPVAPDATAAVYASWLVNAVNDTDDGACDEEHCSLREAVKYSAAGDTIDFDLLLPATIVLDGSEILIDKDLTITGPGADRLAVSGNGVSRVFNMYHSSSDFSVTMSGLTIRDGQADLGGGIHVGQHATLSMNDCVIGPDNIATVAGGGIANGGGVLNLNRCTVMQNHDTGGVGAGVDTRGSGSSTTLVNSTVSGNVTDNLGGGIFSTDHATVSLIHCTITGNTANADYSVDPDGGGGGIYVGGYGEVQLQNSIVAGNFDLTDPATGGHAKWPDVARHVGFPGSRLVSLGGNLIGDGTGSTGWDGSDLVGDFEEPIDPVLGALALNAPGRTPTCALSAASPAFDAAPTCEATTDQRGVTRPRGSACDIGAYELGVAGMPITLHVNAVDDMDDVSCDATHCSLREAVKYSLPGDTIEFALSLPNTIVLGGSEIVIDKNLTITGPGADRLAISGAELSRVFKMYHSTSDFSVTISGLTIKDGRASIGGGIEIGNHATLTLNDCVIGPNNVVTYAGGGINNYAGHLTLNRCTVMENHGTGTFGGAGISTNGSGTSTTLVNSTISGNVTNNFGGGILCYQNGTVTLIHCTITDNEANADHLVNSVGGGGGIYIDTGGQVQLQNTIVAGNTDYPGKLDPDDKVVHAAWPDAKGTFTSQGGNLIGDGTGSEGWNLASDQVGTSAAPINPLLGPLALNAPGHTLTHALLVGSPALDAAPTCEATTDQRGVTRSEPCDIGAYEGLPGVQVQSVTVTASKAGSQYHLKAIVTIVYADGSGIRVNKALVDGEWTSGGTTETDQATTGKKGTATFRGPSALAGTSVKFCVTGVTKTNYQFVPGGDNDCSTLSVPTLP